MGKTAWIVGGTVVFAAGVGALVFVFSGPSGGPSPVKADGIAKSLGISATAGDEDPEKAEERELEALQSGEAAKSVGREIEKAEALLQKQQPGSDQHKMLSRRVAMLKKLKERMRQ